MKTINWIATQPTTNLIVIKEGRKIKAKLFSLDDRTWEFASLVKNYQASKPETLFRVVELYETQQLQSWRAAMGRPEEQIEIKITWKKEA